MTLLATCKAHICSLKTLPKVKFATSAIGWLPLRTVGPTSLGLRTLSLEIVVIIRCFIMPTLLDKHTHGRGCIIGKPLFKIGFVTLILLMLARLKPC